MRKLLFLPLLILVAFTAKAQNRGIIKAVILDSVSHEPVQLATVSLLRLSDTSLISYTVTDKNGAFTLHNLKQEPSRLLISHVGYQGLHFTIDFKKGGLVDLGSLYLSAKMLQEVTVKGERIPVMLKKDTIEFDAMAFKTRPNAMVIDLLKKLPGVQVNMDGGISVNGKDVSKIKVNGKDFFSNSSIALNNLPAEIISKVQVYDDREDDPDHLVPDHKLRKIINLKFKNGLTKGILSSLGGGGGNQGRYIGAGFASKFDDKIQVAGHFNVDNLSGTTNFLGNSGGFYNSSPIMGNSAFRSGSSGTLKSASGSVEFTEDIGKKVKLHLEYRGVNTVSDNNVQSKVQQNISDTVITSLNQSLAHNATNDQNLHGEFTWNPNEATIIKYNPDIEYTYHTDRNSNSSVNSNNFVSLLNTTLNTDHGRNTDFDYHHSISYYHRVNKNSSLSFGNSISFRPSNSLNFNAGDLMSYVAGFPSDTLRRSAKNTNNDASQVVSARYNLYLSKKFSLDVSAIALHDLNKGELLTYDEDLKTGLYTIFLQSQSNNLTRNLWGESVNPELTYNIADDIYIKAGLNMLTQQIGNHFNSTVPDLNRDYFYLFPGAEIHIKKFTVGYNESVQQPSINNLQPITIVYDPLHTFIGNPLLKPSFVHNIRGSFQLNKFQSGFNLNINPQLVIETNTVVDAQVINAEGAKVTTPINGKGRTTFGLNGGLFKNFKKHGKWEFSVAANANASAGHNYFIVNQQRGYQNTRSISFSPGFVADWNNVVLLEPSYGIDYAFTNYKDINYQNTSYTTHTARMKADIGLPDKFRWIADYNYRYVPYAPAGFQHSANLLNLTISRRVQKKDKGEIAIMCYDLLNQNVSQQHYVSLNTINDIQSQVQIRYILLTYTYHFDKFK